MLHQSSDAVFELSAWSPLTVLKSGLELLYLMLHFSNLHTNLPSELWEL